jgi:hypothetical protein
MDGLTLFREIHDAHPAFTQHREHAIRTDVIEHRSGGCIRIVSTAFVGNPVGRHSREMTSTSLITQ